MQTEKHFSIDKRALRWITCYAIVFLALILIAYHLPLRDWLISVLQLFSPILLGLAFAYVINPVFRFFERKLFSHLRPAPLRRALSLLCSYLFFLLLVILLLLLILPQLITAVSDFVFNYQSHVNSVIGGINGLFGAANSFFANIIGKDDFFQPITSIQLFDWLYKVFEEFLHHFDVDTVTGTASSVMGATTDVIFAIFISIYLLASKEKRYAQIMKLRNALFGKKTNQSITAVCTAIDRFFGKFIEGRLMDSIIVWLLLYVALRLFGIPYAIMISAFVAIASFIPAIGFIIGAIPAGLIILLTNVEKLIPFLLIVFIVSQIDGNIIGPKIVGNNTGISALCVIIAICITGTALGPIGLLIAVPLFATMLELLDTFIHNRLRKKKLPDDVENYYAPDPIIEPVRNVATGSARLTRALEKRVLKLERLIEGGLESELTRTDRAILRLYELSRRFHLLSEVPPDVLTQFAAENAEHTIRRNAERMDAAQRAALGASKQPENSRQNDPTEGD